MKWRGYLEGVRNACHRLAEASHEFVNYSGDFGKRSCRSSVENAICVYIYIFSFFFLQHEACVGLCCREIKHLFASAHPTRFV